MGKTFMTADEFAETICSGVFYDADPGFNGKVYRIEATVLRLSPAAYNQYLSANAHEEFEDSGKTPQEWEEHLNRKKALREDFQNKICAACGYPTNVTTVRQSECEIFTVVYIHEIA